MRQNFDTLLKRYGWLIHPVVALLITRLVLALGGVVSDAILPDAYSPWDPYPTGGFMDGWTRGDAMWYINIAEEGYSMEPGADREDQTNVVFFPIYPMLVSLIRPLFLGNTILAGVFVSYACLLGALIFLYRLVMLEFDNEDTAARAVYYMAIAPTAYFFGAIYTESAFILFSIGTFYFTRKKQWLLAGIFGALTAATRMVGVMIAVAVAIEWLRAQGIFLGRFQKGNAEAEFPFSVKDMLAKWYTALPVLLVPLGLLSYLFYLQTRFGDAFIFMRQLREGWERSPNNVITTLWNEAQFMVPFLARGEFAPFALLWVINISALTITLIISVFAWRRLGTAYGLYALSIALIPVAGGTISLSRYLLVVFPVNMMIAHWADHPFADRLILISSSLLLGIFGAIYVNWGFIA